MGGGTSLDALRGNQPAFAKGVGLRLCVPRSSPTAKSVVICDIDQHHRAPVSAHEKQSTPNAEIRE